MSLSIRRSSSAHFALKRQQEIDERGLLVPGEPAKCLDGSGGLAVMGQDRIRDIGGAAIVQETTAQAETPQRRSAPVLAGCSALHDAVVHRRPQIVQKEIRIERNVD